jgi:hypothetical protein
MVVSEWEGAMDTFLVLDSLDPATKILENTRTSKRPEGRSTSSTRPDPGDERTERLSRGT